MKKLLFMIMVLMPLMAFSQKKIGNKIGRLLNIQDTTLLYTTKWQVTNIVTKQKNKIRLVDSTVVNDSIYYDFSSTALVITQRDSVERYKLIIDIDTLDGGRTFFFGMYPVNKDPGNGMAIDIIYLSKEVCVLNIRCHNNSTRRGRRNLRFCRTIVLQPSK